MSWVGYLCVSVPQLHAHRARTMLSDGWGGDTNYVVTHRSTLSKKPIELNKLDYCEILSCCLFKRPRKKTRVQRKSIFQLAFHASYNYRMY